MDFLKKLLGMDDQPQPQQMSAPRPGGLPVGSSPQIANNGRRYEDQGPARLPLASQWQSRFGNFQQDDVNGINPQGFNFGITGLANRNAVQPMDMDLVPGMGRFQRPAYPMQGILDPQDLARYGKNPRITY